ncbi:unnamed protein product, partial [marine sediment metagenome]
SGYERFLHGEAVAIGMMGSAMLSQKLGLLPQDIVKRQEGIIQIVWPAHHLRRGW